MEYEGFLSRYRRSISDVIVRYNWHLSFLLICACVVAQRSLLELGVDASMGQVEENPCHEITDLMDLTHALINISDWKNLGHELRVPDVTIENIENDEKGAENKRRAVLHSWYNLQNHNPCWQSVTDVLRQLGQNRLATKIEQCTECIQSGTDCNLATCLKNGVDKCTCSHFISSKHVFNGPIILLGVIFIVLGVIVIVLVHLYFSYRILWQDVQNWLMSRSTSGLPQHQCYLNAEHKDLILKQLPRLRYTGSLATTDYHDIAEHFERLYSPSNYDKIKKFAKKFVDGSHIDADLKAFALCWEASCEIFLREQYEEGEKLLRAAWEKASPIECKNGLLLQGMICRLFAAISYNRGKYDEALDHIDAAKARLWNAVPSKETALVLYRETVVKWRELVMLRITSADEYKSIEKDFDNLLEHANYVKKYEKSYIFLFRMEKAKFHLRTLLISDMLPPDEFRPTNLDLEKAKKCLDGVSLDMLLSEASFYAVNYYNAHCDLCLWNKQYPEAMAYVKKAKQLFPHDKSETLATRRFNERLKLLERHEKINNILKNPDS